MTDQSTEAKRKPLVVGVAVCTLDDGREVTIGCTNADTADVLQSHCADWFGCGLFRIVFDFGD